uniref:Uncharacterized protein n=1 Tax=viral metagenome TaxID=1070528 RepID=A0A6M3KTT7_9ZZZZ
MTRDEAAWLEILRQHRAGGKDWKLYAAADYGSGKDSVVFYYNPEHLRLVAPPAPRAEVFAEYFRSEGHRRRMRYARLKMALRRFWRAIKG